MTCPNSRQSSSRTSRQPSTSLMNFRMSRMARGEERRSVNGNSKRRFQNKRRLVGIERTNRTMFINISFQEKQPRNGFKDPRWTEETDISHLRPTPFIKRSMMTRGTQDTLTLQDIPAFLPPNRPRFHPSRPLAFLMPLLPPHALPSASRRLLRSRIPFH